MGRGRRRRQKGKRGKRKEERGDGGEGGRREGEMEGKIEREGRDGERGMTSRMARRATGIQRSF